MKIRQVCNEPAIIDVYYDELEQVDFEPIFNIDEEYRLNYADLHVNDGRKTIPGKSQEFDQLFLKLKSPILSITSELLSMDKKRYPVCHIEEFMIKCRIGLLCTVDYPGFSQPWHLDNRFIVLSGVINVVDNSTSTTFSRQNSHWITKGKDFSDTEIIYRGNSKKLHGTAWLNTELTWHCVPEVSEIRKILLYNIFFY
jgi:hypothetical protein